MLIEEGVKRLHELEHIRIGGTNLLKATGLKKNMDYTGCFSISTKAWSISDNKTIHGNRSFRCDCDDKNNYYGVHQAMYLKSNTTYTMSMWILFDGNSGDDDGVVMQCSCKDANDKYYYLVKQVRAKNLTKGVWNLVTHTFTTRDLLNIKQDICIQPDLRKFHGYIGDIKLELGSHYSDWSPAPEDLLLWDNPIGSVKIMGSDIKPADTIGGTWVQTCQGRKPIGVGTGKDVNGLSKTFTLKQNGGEYTHKQTENELAPHVHGQHIINDGGATTGKTYRCDYQCDGLAVSVYPQNIDTMSSGGGQAMNVTDPFQAFYFWMRTA